MEYFFFLESVESHVAITDQSGVTHTNGIPMATSVEIGHQDISTHACPPDNCHNGGTCIRGSSGFLCNCPPGFHGLNCGSMLLYFKVFSTMVGMGGKNFALSGNNFFLNSDVKFTNSTKRVHAIIV